MRNTYAPGFRTTARKTSASRSSKGEPSTYIILGIVMTLVFILVVFGIVKLVTTLAGV